MFRSKVEAVAYLSGIIDGEGSVAFRRDPGRSETSRARVREVSIVNTDPGILEACREALRLLGVEWREHVRKDGGGFGSKPVTVIYTRRRADLEILAAELRLRSTEKAERLRQAVETYTMYGRLPDRDEFERVYTERGQRGAAMHYGVSNGTIFNWRTRFGIPGRAKKHKIER